MAVSRRGFLQTLGVASCATAASASGAENLPPGMTTGFGIAGAQREIYVGNERQYLCDDFLLATGNPRVMDQPINIRFNVGNGEKDPTPVMLPRVGAPWETVAMSWVSVLHDGGRYRCWYITYRPNKVPLSSRHLGLIATASETYRPARVPLSSGMVSYAESEDGVNWRKPILNLIELNGSKRNNVCFPGILDDESEPNVLACHVFIDPSADAQKRYKMVFHGTHRTLHGAYSSDGLNWKVVPGSFVVCGIDTQNSATYDPVLQRYVAYIRSDSLNYGGLDVGPHPVEASWRGRAIARIEGPMFVADEYPYWSVPEIVLAPDIHDGLNIDFYTNPYSYYGNVHFMLFSLLDHYHGSLNIQVALSRDNRQWVRPTRSILIPNGSTPGSYDQFRVYAGPGILPAGKDRIAIYTWGGMGPHPGSVVQDYNPGSWKPWQGPPEGCMSRVTFGRDRIVGIEAGQEIGNFATRPLIFNGRRLVVNVEPIGADPELRVQLIKCEPNSKPTLGELAAEEQIITRRTFDQCTPITTDELDAGVGWKEGLELGEWSGKPIRLHFHLRSMRIYAFQFVA